MDSPLRKVIHRFLPFTINNFCPEPPSLVPESSDKVKERQCKAAEGQGKAVEGQGKVRATPACSPAETSDGSNAMAGSASR